MGTRETSAVDYANTVSLVLALARGHVHERAAVVDWSAAFRVAERERLAPLCWHRAAAVIRSCAPQGVSETWRAHAIANAARADSRLATLSAVLEMLGDAGVKPVVLKGLPLALSLYGDIAFRPSGDTDLFIHAAQRTIAEAALQGWGWAGSYGRAPREAAFRRREQGGIAVLEVHSSLADDNLLLHLRLPEPEWREVRIGGTTVRALDGAMVPVCIALHLAKRFAPPLLWVLDLLTAWERLDESERARTKDVAASCRLARCLADALARAEAVDAATTGDGNALAQLWYTPRGRRDRHNALRVAQLADTPLDVARVAIAWAWPHEFRRAPGVYARTAAARVGRVLRQGSASPEVSASGGPPVESLPIPGPLHEPVRDLLSFGVPVWIRATGSSMRPAIAPGTRVRLIDARAVMLRRGDVVLARLASGRTVLHRVRRIEWDQLILRGDNATGPDAPVARSAVIGVADLMEVGGRVGEIPRRPRKTWRALAGDARRLAAAAARVGESRT